MGMKARRPRDLRTVLGSHDDEPGEVVEGWDYMRIARDVWTIKRASATGVPFALSIANATVTARRDGSVRYRFDVDVDLGGNQ